MELQLGLSLLPGGANFTTKPTAEIKEGFGSNQHLFSGDDCILNSIKKKKRSFCRAFDSYYDHDHQIPPQKNKFPSLRRNNPSNDDDDNTNLIFAPIKNEKEEKLDGIVGWPPIKQRRRRDRTVENGCGCGERVSRFMYVKVKMEGVGIARKVDLALHASFDTLQTTLMDMFGRCHGGSDNYKLTYQDRDGDWLLAHSVSWRTFIRTVQRLKLLRRNH